MIPIKDKEGSSESPLEVSNLLSEFGDVISDNVPEELPPVRQISHQIDLIPIDSFPNKAAHRMTPTETEELNRQGQGAIEEGFDSREPESMCSACSTGTKEGWGVENVYRFSSYKQDNHQVSVSFAKNG